MLSTLKNSNFRTHMLGQSISQIGTFMQITALSWLARSRGWRAVRDGKRGISCQSAG